MTLHIQSDADGIGRPINPHAISSATPMAGMNSFESYHHFEQSVQRYPVYDAKGELLRNWEGEAEEVWQFKPTTYAEDWEWEVEDEEGHQESVKWGIPTRRIYRATQEAKEEPADSIPTGSFYPLFHLMSHEHGLTLLESELWEIVDCVNEMQKQAIVEPADSKEVPPKLEVKAAEVTAEKIFNQWQSSSAYIHEDDAIGAMEEYASLKTASLEDKEAENQRLREALNCIIGWGKVHSCNLSVAYGCNECLESMQQLAKNVLNQKP